MLKNINAEMVPCTCTQITKYVPLVTQKGGKSHFVALFTEKDSYTNLKIIIIIIIIKNEGSQGYNFQSIFCTSVFSFTSSASHGILYKFFLVRQPLKVLVAQTQFDHKYGEMPENSFPF